MLCKLTLWRARGRFANWFLPTYCVGLPICLPLPTWDVKPPTLLPLLGPTVLPLTHTTGVVEQSTRHIVRVDPPRVPHLLAQNVPAAEAVKENLARRARVTTLCYNTLLYVTMPPNLLLSIAETVTPICNSLHSLFSKPDFAMVDG
ncbi:hypothetical protein EDB83DRAFT_2530432 [Lactarius deliciosus]|nr:hypothetical protein EDB83DRAFT_2530432 [Lactarius deliciosus]